MTVKISSGGARGAIDPHTHILPQGFIEDVRRGRFGPTVTIEQDKGSEWVIGRGGIPGKSSELKIKLVPLRYEPELRLKDMERMGSSRR